MKLNDYNKIQFFEKENPIIPVRLKIINILEKQNKPISQLELSRRINTSKTNTIHHVRLLEKLGFIKIEKSKGIQHNPLMISLK